MVSTNPDFYGFDMGSGAQSAEFLVLLDGVTTQYVQSYQPISYDASISRKYAGAVLARGGFVQVGYDSRQFQKDIDAHIDPQTICAAGKADVDAFVGQAPQFDHITMLSLRYNGDTDSN